MNPETMRARLAQSVVAPGLSVSAALARLQDAGTTMLLLASDDRHLLGVLTDGDVRRHILAGGSLEHPCGDIASRCPVVARADMSPEEILQLMDTAREFVVNQLPVVGPDGVIVGFWLRSDFVTAQPGLSAVIMAGGYGKRLHPLTESTPKPMLPVGDRPLLERTVERLRRAGIDDLRVATHYLGERISSHFGNGEAFGVHIEYLPEERPLGTAGALAGLRGTTRPLLVLNGDILTGVDFHAMLAYHQEHGADATVGVRRCELQVPYGVVECSGSRIQRLQEKPVQQLLVNAGIYILQPAVLKCVPEGRRFDMTDLIQRLLDDRLTVVSFPIVEYWLDIGQPADYERAQLDARGAGALL